MNTASGDRLSRKLNIEKIRERRRKLEENARQNTSFKVVGSGTVIVQYPTAEKILSHV